ncbi:MAG: hypothetical protein IPI01_21170 [Ignavibacteriae bacterium]|nr:hypothetical protein [Ignavibacteriota bacterium]
MNVALDLKLREDLFNFRINLFQCPSCQTEGILFAPLLSRHGPPIRHPILSRIIFGRKRILQEVRRRPAHKK